MNKERFIMKKEIYTSPEVEIIEFTTEDVISDSIESELDSSPW